MIRLSWMKPIHKKKARRFYISVVLFLVPLLGCSGNADFEDALRLLSRELEGAIYFVPGWVIAQKIEGLRRLERADVEFRFTQCRERITPSECDRESKWQEIKQTFALARFRRGSAKVLEVVGASTPDGPTTNHAVVYRCLQGAGCTNGDLGPLATPPIPCRDHDSCERAAAFLEKLIALAQEKP
jgi:hypothetical protein